MKRDVSKDGYYASIAVLQDDSILIAWQKVEISLPSISTHTPAEVRQDGTKQIQNQRKHSFCIAEFSTGEIAFPDG